jgi:hypothetical protein
MLPALAGIHHLAAILSARLTTRIRKRNPHLLERSLLTDRQVAVSVMVHPDSPVMDVGSSPLIDMQS